MLYASYLYGTLEGNFDGAFRAIGGFFAKDPNITDDFDYPGVPGQRVRQPDARPPQPGQAPGGVRLPVRADDVGCPATTRPARRSRASAGGTTTPGPSSSSRRAEREGSTPDTVRDGPARRLRPASSARSRCTSWRTSSTCSTGSRRTQVDQVWSARPGGQRSARADQRRTTARASRGSSRERCGSGVQGQLLAARVGPATFRPGERDARRPLDDDSEQQRRDPGPDEALRRGRRGGRGVAGHPAGRVLLAARPVGLRQDDAAAHDRRLRAADRGRDPHQRRGHDATAALRAARSTWSSSTTRSSRT